MKVYTRRGDAGETDLFGGERVAKDHLRVEAYGAVDELNATLGVAGAASGSPEVRALVEALQARLFDLGAQLATPDPARRAKGAVLELHGNQTGLMVNADLSGMGITVK